MKGEQGRISCGEKSSESKSETRRVINNVFTLLSCLLFTLTTKLPLCPRAPSKSSLITKKLYCQAISIDSVLRFTLLSRQTRPLAFQVRELKRNSKRKSAIFSRRRKEGIPNRGPCPERWKERISLSGSPGCETMQEALIYHPVGLFPSSQSKS